MKSENCDINDVTRAASDLVALGCSIGATQLLDSFRQLQFSEVVSSFANDIIEAVDQGVISAQEGLQIFLEEHSELTKKAAFYTQNGIGIAGGLMQLQTGTVIIGSSRGSGTIPGAAFLLHGTNNIYESMANIYNGPNNPNATGLIRQGYQILSTDAETGNKLYYSVDLGLSIYGLFRPVRKIESIELFIKDQKNYEAAIKQTGKLALTLEALVDALTFKNLKGN